MLWQFWTMAECKGTTSAEFHHSFIWLPVCLFFCTKNLMIKGLLVGVKFFTSRVDPKFIRSINTFWRSYFCSKCIQSTWFRVIFLFLKPKGKQIFCGVFIWQVRHFLLGKLPNALDIVGNKADKVLIIQLVSLLASECIGSTIDLYISAKIEPASADQAATSATVVKDQVDHASGDATQGQGDIICYTIRCLYRVCQRKTFHH